MRNEYRSGYAEGGFLDDGASVDPVSGNEVPTGSLAEEVRDDIPAQLSEGEFVVPADVVRFIGLDKLMKMRESAKAGLANMEAEGQMGGSPAPMQQPEMDDGMEMDALIDGMDNDDFEGAAQMFAEGGAVTDLPSYNTTKAASTAGTLGDLPTYKKYTGGREFNVPDTVTYVKYTNDAGDIIDVATVRGKPVNPVPDGYYLVGSKGDEGGGSGVGSSAPTRSTVNSGPVDKPNPAIVQHRKLSSDKVTRQRNKIIKEISGGILDGDIDPRGEGNSMIGYVSNTALAEQEMLKVMLPDAIKLYEGITNNPSFLDEIFYKDKTKLEVMVMSVKQTQNAREQAGELDPSYVNLVENGSTFMMTNGVQPEGVVISPEEAIINKEKSLGKTPNLKELVVGVVTGLIDLSTSGMVGAVLDFVSTKTKNQDEAVKIVNDVLQEAVTTGEITPDLENKIQIVDTANVVDTRDELLDTTGAADTRDELLDTTGAADTRDEALDNVGSGTPYSPSAGTEYSPEGVGTRYSPAAGTEYAPEGTGVASLTDVDPSTPAIKPVVDSQLKMDIGDVANPFNTSAVTTGIPSANIISGAESDLMSLLDAEDALDTGATLGTVGTTGVTAGVTPMTTTMTTAQKKQANLDNIAAIAVANGLDPDDAMDAWNASGKTGTLADLVVEQEKVVKQQKKQDRQDRQDAYDRQVAKVAKEEADRKAAADLTTQKLLDTQSRLQGDRTPTPPPTVTLPDQVNSGRFDPPPSTVNSGNDGNGPKGNNSGPVGGSTSGPKSRGGRQRQQRSQQQNSGREDYAYGGLALKKEPVKKMRKDPTSGLAAKKKSKQKAQAKKGALAAKRT